MHTIGNRITHPSSSKSVYRYSGQPLYALYELVDESLQSIRQLHEKTLLMTGYPTGFCDLDHLLSGLQPGSLTIIASYASMGKSALALNIAQNLGVTNAIPTALFSLEMSKEQMVMRMLAAAARVDLGKARTGHLTESDLRKLEEAKEALRNSAIYVDDTSGISGMELLAKVVRLKIDHDVQVIIIDYLQLMRDDTRSALDPEELSRISSSLKVLARELDVAVVLLSQLDSRTVKKSRPELSDLGNTGSLESDADLILLLYRETVYCTSCRRRDGSCTHNHEQAAEIIIAKHKNGTVGSVFLNFDAETMNFTDLC